MDLLACKASTSCPILPVAPSNAPCWVPKKSVPTLVPFDSPKMGCCLVVVPRMPQLLLVLLHLSNRADLDLFSARVRSCFPSDSKSYNAMGPESIRLQLPAHFPSFRTSLGFLLTAETALPMFFLTRRQTSLGPRFDCESGQDKEAKQAWEAAKRKKQVEHLPLGSTWLRLIGGFGSKRGFALVSLYDSKQVACGTCSLNSCRATKEACKGHFGGAKNFRLRCAPQATCV